MPEMTFCFEAAILQNWTISGLLQLKITPPENVVPLLPNLDPIFSTDGRHSTTSHGLSLSECLVCDDEPTLRKPTVSPYWQKCIHAVTFGASTVRLCLCVLVCCQGTSVLSPVLHIGSVIVLAVMIYKKSAVQLFEKHPCLYILAFGFVSAKITNKLVVSQTDGTPAPPPMTHLQFPVCAEHVQTTKTRREVSPSCSSEEAQCQEQFNVVWRWRVVLVVLR